LRRLALPVLTLAAILLSACGSTSTSSTDVSGTVRLNGSSALDPMVKAVTDDFQSQYTKVTIQSQPTDSGTGLSQVAAGNVEIGMSDFPKSAVKDLQNSDQLVDHQVAVSGVAVVASKKTSIGVDGVSSQQAHDIYTGKIKNWKDVGGADLKIVLVGRKSSSGTRKGFDKVVMGSDPESADVQEQTSGGNLVKLVSDTPGAIGYAGFGDIKADSNVLSLKLDGADPTVDALIGGTYKLWFHEHMFTKGEASGATKAFLDYITSDKVQNGDAITKAKFAPLNKVKGTSPADS
jgi:phosphate transport system substrate-binding protein